MSKYNLTDILNEYIGGGRIGTLKTSYRDLVDIMDKLEKSDKVIVRELPGPSGDGKTNREFEVVDRDSAVAGGKKQERGFTVYDYKFGFDPGSIDNYEEEYDFSVGGNDLKLAMELIPDVKPYRLEELDIDSIQNDPGSGDADNPTGEELEASGGYDAAMEESHCYNEDDINEGEFDEARQAAIESSQEKAGIREENVIKDLAQADEIIKMIKMMNPDVREDLLKRIARMGQKLNEGDLFSSEFDRQELKAIINDLNKGLILDMPTRRAYKFLVSLLDKEDKKELGVSEQMYIDDDEFEMEMGRSKKDSLKKEMIIHVDQLIDGNIDMNDFMNVVEDIMAEVKSIKEISASDKLKQKAVEDELPRVKKILKKFGFKSDYDDDDIRDFLNVDKMLDAIKDADDDDVYEEYIEFDKGKIKGYGGVSYVGMREVMNIDRKGRKKPESKSNMTKVNEASQKESVAKYIIDYYRNPNKPEETMVNLKIANEYFKTHPDWHEYWGKSNEEGINDFNEFFDANYGYMFPSADEIDEDLKRHFKRFM